MTEVVTQAAALSQLTLLAEKQQVARSESRSNDQFAVEAAKASARPNAAEVIAKSAANDQSSLKQDNSQHQQEAAPRGPSKARVELKSFDIGRTAAEVVGTVDVKQRFDSNGDGRVDSLESNAALRARSKQSSYKGLAAAAAAARHAADAFDGLEKVETQPIVLTPAPVAPKPAHVPDAPTAPNVKKYADKEVAGEATPLPGTKKFSGPAEEIHFDDGTAGTEVAKKYYGQGAEAVVGQFAVEQPQKYSDKAPETTRFSGSEDGTGEAKYYDKVPQTETGQFSGEPGQEKMYDRAQQVQAQSEAAEGEGKSMYEKAQEVAAVSTTDTLAAAEPKKVYAELEVYAEAVAVTSPVPQQTVQVAVTA